MLELLVLGKVNLKKKKNSLIFIEIHVDFTISYISEVVLSPLLFFKPDTTLSSPTLGSAGKPTSGAQNL